MKLIYEFRYYCLLPFNDNGTISQREEIKNQIKEVEMLLLEKAHTLKLIDVFAKERKRDYQILKNIFHVRVINLEDIYIKVMKEKDGNYYIQLFDEEAFEEKIQLEDIESLDKNDILFKLNKKVKIFH